MEEQHIATFFNSLNGEQFITLFPSQHDLDLDDTSTGFSYDNYETQMNHDESKNLKLENLVSILFKNKSKCVHTAT